MNKQKAIICLLALSFIFQIAFAQAYTTISVNPANTNVNKSNNFSISVDINTSESVSGFDIMLYFNKNIISGISATEGDFLNKDGKATYTFMNSVNNTGGYVRFILIRLGLELPGVSGNGSLFTINFNGIEKGQTNLGLKNMGISNDQAEEIINVLTINGSVSVLMNSAPILTSIGSKSVNEDSLLEFTISASDIDEDVLIYSAENLPDGAIFNPSTKTFSWTPNYEQSGIYPNIKFSVSDGILTTAENITITVSNTNRIPVINSFFPLTNIAKVLEGGSVQFNQTSSDLDNDVLSYKWFLNGLEKVTTQSWLYQTYDKSCSGIGIKNITVIVSDVYGDVSHSWIADIWMKGDTNNDKNVSILDLANIGYSYNSQAGDINWNNNTDFNLDGKVNIFDLTTVGLNYWRIC